MRRFLPFLLVACLTPEPGQIGNGNFSYICASSADDAFCDATGNALHRGSMPQAIAVGSHFSVSYTPNVDQGAAVQSGAPNIFSAMAGGFDALRAGTGSIIGLQNGRADDFAYVQFAAPTSFEVRQQVGLTSLSLLAVPVAGGAELAGHMTCAWSWQTSNPMVASVTGAGRSASVQIFDYTRSVDVTVTCGGASGKITINARSDAGAG